MHSAAGSTTQTVQDPCTGNNMSLIFPPMAPYPITSDGNAYPVLNNQGYNCSSPNGYFLGCFIKPCN